MKRWLLFFSLLGMMISCSKKTEPEEDVLVKYNDKTLTLQDVVSQIPTGLPNSDSVTMFKNIVDGWIKTEVLSAFAEERLYDVSSIDRKVRDYRNSLIVQEYISRMADAHRKDVDPLKVKQYYDLHKDEMTLELPLIKGVFIKINNDAKGRESLQGLLKSDDINDIDELEKEWLDRALEYNYFKDNWIDWETIVGMIPYRFGDASEFVNNNTYLETDYGDCAYFLRITDVLPAGEIQPFEYASVWIADVLYREQLEDYEEDLLNSLISKYIKDKKLEIVDYNPQNHQMIKTK